MFKYILFDLDGTLINSNDVIIKCLRETAKKYINRDLSNEELNNILGKPIKDQLLLIHNKNVEEMIECYKKLYRKYRDELTKEFEGIKEMLDTLKEKGYTMGIVTSKGTSGIEHALTKFHMHRYFDVTISANDVENHKPHPEPILKALKALDGNIQEAILIGDSLSDILCGKNTGIITILVDWSILPREMLLKADPNFVAKTPEDIVNIIEGKNLRVGNITEKA
jgi:pyrophosphatase PpaX